MATLRELRKRFRPAPQVQARFGSDELLVADSRGEMSPSRFVEEKFRAAMAGRLRADDAASRKPTVREV